MSLKLVTIIITILLTAIVGASLFMPTSPTSDGVALSETKTLQANDLNNNAGNKVSDFNNPENNSSNFSSSEKMYSELHKSPYQTKPRRRKIVYPDDCESKAGYVLETVCGETLEKSISILPAEGCNYEEFQTDKPRYREEIKGYLGTLTYKIQETDTDGIEKLAERLETTSDNIIRNSKLQKPFELKVGQELKYEKARLIKDFSTWLDYTRDITFYSLAVNKYLVKVRCLAGAYNELNVYLLYDESAIPAKIQVLEFPYLTLHYRSDLNDYDEKNDVPDSVEKVMVKSIGGRYFNPKTKELIVFVKAHGIGDAGRYARYSFPNGKPKLEEFRARIIWSGRGYQPDDVIKSPPKTWKKYYPE